MNPLRRVFLCINFLIQGRYCGLFYFLGVYMAGHKGSKVIIKKGAVKICSGVTSKKIKFNGEAIDITSDDDNGWRSLLSESGVRSIDLSFEGVAKDITLRTARLNDANMFTDVSLVFEDLSTITGSFFMASYEEDAKTNEVVSFSCELQSSGPMVYTPPV